jgi:hypothetical protein
MLSINAMAADTIYVAQAPTMDTAYLNYLKHQSEESLKLQQQALDQAHEHQVRSEDSIGGYCFFVMMTCAISGIITLLMINK